MMIIVSFSIILIDKYMLNLDHPSKESKIKREHSSSEKKPSSSKSEIFSYLFK